MQCPIDKVDLVMSERHGIEVDYCPKCRGVWLDRGELDKIIERAGTAVQPAEDYRRPAPPRQEPDYDRRHYEKPHHKKRKSFLDDIFDF